MTKNPSGLFKTSIKCVIEAFHDNALFRNGTIAIVLLAAVAGVPLALTGGEVRDNSAVTTTLGLSVVLLPLEFLLYDLVLMVHPPKGSLTAMLFDPRLPSYLWRAALLAVVFFTPQLVVSLALTPPPPSGRDPNAAMAAFAVLAAVLLWIVLLPPLLRVMFFPVMLAADRPKPVRTSFRETKGKLWRIARAMFLPMTFLSLLDGLLLTGPLLCAQGNVAGFAAVYAVCVAGIIAINSVETAFFAVVYRRIVEPAAPAPVLVPAGQPTSFDVQ